MVYFDYSDLGYTPFIKSWLATKKGELGVMLGDLIAKFIEPLLLFKKQNCVELIPINEVNGIQLELENMAYPGYAKIFKNGEIINYIEF